MWSNLSYFTVQCIQYSYLALPIHACKLAGNSIFYGPIKAARNAADADVVIENQEATLRITADLTSMVSRTSSVAGRHS